MNTIAKSLAIVSFAALSTIAAPAHARGVTLDQPPVTQQAVPPVQDWCANCGWFPGAPRY